MEEFFAQLEIAEREVSRPVRPAKPAAKQKGIPTGQLISNLLYILNGNSFLQCFSRRFQRAERKASDLVQRPRTPM
jgi:hypothetical protein